MQLRAVAFGTGTLAFLLLFQPPSQTTFSIGAPHAFQPAAWSPAGNPPGEIQSTVIRYRAANGSIKARIVISSDTVPFSSKAFVPAGSVAFQDAESTAAQPSSMEIPPECSGINSLERSVPCDWGYLSNDNDLVSDGNNVVYYMPGVGYRGPSANPTRPQWFSPPQSISNSTARGTFGPNTRSAVAVWKSTDYGQTFQWSSFFDPSAYFDGSCAYPQYKSIQTPGYSGVPLRGPFDMAGSDGQSVRYDPLTGKLVLAFQCVGYQPSHLNPWTLPTQPVRNGRGTPLLNPDGSQVLNPSGTPVNETLIAEFDGQHWSSVVMPTGVTGWRMRAIPYGHFMLLGAGQFAIADMAQPLAAPTVSVPAGPNPMPPWGWGNFPQPWFLHANFDATNVLTRWGHNGYAFAYPTLNTLPGGTTVNGYSVYYFSLPETPTSTTPVPQWVDVPIQLNPLNPGATTVDLTTVDLGSNSTLLYWYEINPADQTAIVRGRMLLDNGESSQDFTISPQFSMLNSAISNCTASANAPGNCYWFGDYKTAGGYCYITGTQLTSVFFPMWLNPSTASAFYSEITYTEPLNPALPIAQSCHQPPPTPPASGSGERILPKQLALQISPSGPLSPGVTASIDTLKKFRRAPDLVEHHP